MTLKRLAVLMVLVLLSAAAPNDAEAQICDETCVIWLDSEGTWAGFGCITGGGFWVNCRATANSCSLDSCRLTSITTVDGTVLAVGSSCELQKLVNGVTEYSGEPYVDDEYLTIVEE
ncbi:hypothetical protein [Candidatus Palauibacter sp.]|uniref:hypothetical protein n=1 Tax=Candidatus Palauibacter sp. TaxID=3101350 RepID=UPI003D0CAF50